MKIHLTTCILIVFLGLVGVITDGGNLNGIPMPGWIYWPITIVGLIGCIGYSRDIKKAKNKPAEPQLPLDDQCVQAKADLDRMYFREHGRMPEWPEKEEEKKENQ